jgi:hypothetical protein
MGSRRRFATAAAVVVSALAGAPAYAQNQNSIAGVVTGPNGPEAGVWVIAETTDLPTRYTKVVVTDGKGRYVIPQLPKAKYHVWSRGYGLKDSHKLEAAPGGKLNIRAVAATPQEDAEHYPGMYWYSMINIPATIRKPAGKAGACGRCRVRAPSSTTKGARRTARRSTTCSCVRIRWRTELRYAHGALRALRR